LPAADIAARFVEIEAEAARMHHALRHGHHHGRARNRLDFNGFSLLRLGYAPNFRDALHQHENASIVVPCAGIAYQSRAGTEQARPVGVHRYHPERELHADRVGPGGWSTLVVEMTPAWAAQLRDEIASFRSGFDVADPAAHAICVKLIAVLDGPRTAIATLRAHGLALEYIATVAEAHSERLPKRAPAWVGEAREYIDASFRSRPSLNAIAHAVHVHPVHLARLFRRTYGETVADYSRRLIAHEALGLLDKGELNVGEIARLLGYSPSHFGALMHAYFGMTPRALRDRAPNGEDQAGSHRH